MAELTSWILFGLFLIVAARAIWLDERLMRLYHALGHPSGADEIDVFDSIQWWRKMALAGQRLAKTADNMPLCVGDYAWAGSIQVRVVSIDENNVAVVDFDGSRSCRAVRSLHWYPKAAKENLNG